MTLLEAFDLALKTHLYWKEGDSDKLQVFLCPAITSAFKEGLMSEDQEKFLLATISKNLCFLTFANDLILETDFPERLFKMSL